MIGPTEQACLMSPAARPDEARAADQVMIRYARPRLVWR